MLPPLNDTEPPDGLGEDAAVVVVVVAGAAVVVVAETAAVEIEALALPKLALLELLAVTKTV